MSAAELTPGSDRAWNQGCVCPIMDNHGGRGVPLSGQVFFWINGACPIHGKPSPAQPDTASLEEIHDSFKLVEDMAATKTGGRS